MWKRRRGTGVLFTLVAAVVPGVGLMIGAASPALAGSGGGSGPGGAGAPIS